MGAAELTESLCLPAIANIPVGLYVPLLEFNPFTRRWSIVSAHYVDSLLDEMQQCQSIAACIELAITDAYGEYEQAGAWLTCIEAMFGRFDRVNVMGQKVALEGFDLSNDIAVVAICRMGKRQARIALESVEFAGLTPVEKRWLKAWQKFFRGLG